MKFKINFFKGKYSFEYVKWHTPIGHTFNHYNKRIHWMISTRFGCVQITAIPHTF